MPCWTPRCCLRSISLQRFTRSCHVGNSVVYSLSHQPFYLFFYLASSFFVSYSGVSYPQRFTRSCAPTTCLDINMCGKAFEVAGRKYSYRKMEARLLEDLQGSERTFSERTFSGSCTVQSMLPGNIRVTP